MGVQGQAGGREILDQKQKLIQKLIFLHQQRNIESILPQQVRAQPAKPGELSLIPGSAHLSFCCEVRAPETAIWALLKAEEKIFIIRGSLPKSCSPSP